ncbi:MAG: single-stranded DNA-binding protein [bacterium]|nr:single-stranded DNA-binding protein [bacterium]
MSSLNKIILIGKIVETPDIRVTNSGDPFIKICLEVVRPYSSAGMAPQSDMINVVGWRHLAENTGSYLKNSTLLVEGSIHTRSYDDSNGNRKWSTEVEARYIKQLSTEPAESAKPADTENKQSLKSTAKESLEETPLDDFNTSTFDFGETEKESSEEDIPF